MNTDLSRKIAVYSSNFRGVPSGWINILKVNFLVGENSTGKSSFLQLIEILDSQKHFFMNELCGVVSGIDTAFDVIARNSQSDEVTVGFFERKSEEDESVFGRISTFRKQGDDLSIKSLTIISGEKVIRLKRGKGVLSYKLQTMNYEKGKDFKENCAEFSNIHFSRSNFKRVKEDSGKESVGIPFWIGALQLAVERGERAEISRFLNFGPIFRCLHYGPLRGKTRRLHYGSKSDFSSTGEHFPYLIRDSLSQGRKLNSKIEKFGKESGLFDSISVASVKTEVKDRPFALQIRRGGATYYIDELGFGVGQILPIVADLSLVGAECTFLLEQPELHLHPKAQASLGEVFFASASEGKSLVIETHSDFIIDRFRMEKQSSDAGLDAQVLFFRNHEENGNEVFEICISDDGSLVEQPDDYREFFLSESFNVFEKL